MFKCNIYMALCEKKTNVFTMNTYKGTVFYIRGINVFTMSLKRYIHASDM